MVLGKLSLYSAVVVLVAVVYSNNNNSNIINNNNILYTGSTYYPYDYLHLWAF